MRSKPGESANLDLLRSVAVLSVYVHHVWKSAVGNESGFSWRLGQLGVAIFFVHTALVLMWSAERLQGPALNLIKTFYIRRAFRIYPLSIFCVAVTYWLFPHRWDHFTLGTNLTLTQNLFFRPDMIYVLWSLPLEVQMYLFLPILFLFCRKRPLFWVFLIWIASVGLALLQQATSARLDVFSYTPNFLGGIIAWRLMSKSDTKYLPGWLWIPVIPIVSTVWMISPRDNNMPYRWMFGLVLGLAIPWFREIPFGWLRKPSQIIAKYSYGIYLSHTTVVWFALTVLASYSAAVRWGVLIVLSAAVPVVLYHCIEAPMISLGKLMPNAGRLVPREWQPQAEPVLR